MKLTQSLPPNKQEKYRILRLSISPTLHIRNAFKDFSRWSHAPVCKLYDNSATHSYNIYLFLAINHPFKFIQIVVLMVGSLSFELH